jgi:polysaccharide export outer membrane protein
MVNLRIPSSSPRVGGRGGIVAAGCLFGLLLSAILLHADQQAVPDRQSAERVAGPPAKDVVETGYVLGGGDQISVWVLGVDEIGEKPLRIDPQGSIDLPLVGRVRVGGMTLDEARNAIAASFQRHVRNPKVSLNVVDYHSQPVSVLGAVNNPGLLQLQGGKTLAEIISMAGGIRPDAGYTVRITRREQWGALPLPTAKPDSTGKFSVADVGLKALLDARDPALNIPVKPYDVISIPRAQLVYVIGEVTKAGGFALNERESVSVLQALSLAGGLSRTAKASDARILRGSGDSGRQDIPVNVQRILDGKAPDLPLQSDDLLYIPSSAAKRGAIRAL